MNYPIPSFSSSNWPSSAWIRCLQFSFYVFEAATIVIWVVTTITMVNLFLATGDIWVALVGQSWWKWAIVLSLVFSYWQHRLKGRLPSDHNQSAWLTYVNRPTRLLIWRAILNYHRDQTQMPDLSLAHLLAALSSQIGPRLMFLRLSFTAEDSQILLTQLAAESAAPAIAQAFAVAAAEQAQIDWSHLMKGMINASPAWSEMLKTKKIKPAEAMAVVDWTRKYLGYRVPTLQFGLLHDLLTPQKNLNKTWTAKATPVLDRFSQNLTDLAKVGLLTSAKVRQKEVEEAVQVLSKSQQNSLILVGEPGVGKTSIVGDLALRMLRGDIPALADYKLISLDLGALIGAGGGNFQQLFSRAMQEAALSGNTILFVGNLDQLGKSKSDAGFDLSAILLNALQNNHLQLIGTSDPLNYKKYIENNSNLVAWFSRVNVNELSADAAILVLEDLSHAIESRQGVMITLDAIKTAVQLSQQYIHTGKLPDTAEDLLDEAAVYASRRGLRVVTGTEVGIVMSSKTNVPIGEIGKEEKSKLVDLDSKIHERLIGQDEAVTAVVDALKRARLGVSQNGKRPIGTFLFLGPTGVGKTELAKSLAWAYFGDESKIVRLDMGEYQTRESVHNLLGAPVVAGDIALAGGSFTEKVKQTPFTVVLLDEIEKAHTEILNVFLRVLDEGKMTDNLGNEIDFTHTMIIATSNAEARFIEESVRGQLPYPELQHQVLERLTQTAFKPELVNRFDGVIVFKPLQAAEIMQIARLKIGQLQQSLRDSKQIALKISEDAVMALVEKGFDPAFGARPLERLIREKVETKVANAMLAEDQVREVIIDKDDILR